DPLLVDLRPVELLRVGDRESLARDDPIGAVESLGLAQEGDGLVAALARHEVGAGLDEELRLRVERVLRRGPGLPDGLLLERALAGRPEFRAGLVRQLDVTLLVDEDREGQLLDAPDPRQQEAGVDERVVDEAPRDELHGVAGAESVEGDRDDVAAIAELAL